MLESDTLQPMNSLQWVTRCEAQDAALGRETSHDRLLVKQLDGARCTVIVVADGAGYSARARAAALHVVQRYEAELSEAAVTLFKSTGSVTETQQLLVAQLKKLDHEVGASTDGAETTAVVLLTDGETIFGASSGDSSARLFTEDGSIDLTARQNRKSRLGSGSARPVAFGPHAFEGRLLVGTDGLDFFPSSKRLAEFVSSAPDIESGATNLLDALRLPSGNFNDDTAFVLGERKVLFLD